MRNTYIIPLRHVKSVNWEEAWSLPFLPCDVGEHWSYCFLVQSQLTLAHRPPSSDTFIGDLYYYPRHGSELKAYGGWAKTQALQ